MDPDFQKVADIVSRDDECVAALMRLAAKSGNMSLQSQVLMYNADRITSRVTTPYTNIQIGTGSGSPPPLVSDIILSRETSTKRPVPVQESAMDHEEGDEELITELENCMNELDDDVKSYESNMLKYLSKPTKMRDTFVKFYKKYGGDEVPRRELGIFMKTEKNILQRSSSNKLFSPPKGFRVGLFVRRGKRVSLSKEWLEAWRQISSPPYSRMESEEI